MAQDKKIPPDDAAEQDELTALVGAALAPVEVPHDRRGRLQGRLMQRVAASAARHARTHCVRLADGAWRRLKSGVEVKALSAGLAGNSVLIRLAAGATLPVHRHQWLEEGIILEGCFRIEGQDLGPGDYHVSPADSVHGRIVSPAGGIAYLRGTAIGDTTAMMRELVGGLLPLGQHSACTVTARDMAWSEVVPGVDQHVVWSDGTVVSRFLRLAAGSRFDLPAAADGTIDCEAIVVSGDAFLGDILLRAGEFALEPAGGGFESVSSDVGVVVFLRGPAA